MPLDNQLGIVLVFEVLAVASVAAGRHHEGATLLGLAETAWRKVGTDLQAFGPQLANLRGQAAARARAALGAAKFQQAHREAAGFNYAQVCTYLDILARTYSDDADVAPASPEPITLTRREREVAALVGKGLSNRDIAARLVLSHRTVEGHVEHILAKLGFRSRAEIAVWATTREPTT
nr:helix-turn-helix transcriptional regulator [Prauserella isguenensis]